VEGVRDSVPSCWRSSCSSALVPVVFVTLAVDSCRCRIGKSQLSHYPNLELSFEVEDPENVTAGAPSYVIVTVERDVDEDEEPDLNVHAPFYPAEKTENWWLVIGEEKTKTLLAIKRVTIAKSLKARLEMVVPTAGKHELTLFLMSDSYVGVDQAPTFEVEVAEGEEDEDDDEEDGDAVQE